MKIGVTHNISSKFGRAFWLIELLGIELVPTILVFLGLVFAADWPVFAALQWVATAVTLAAIIIGTRGCPIETFPG